MGYLAVVVGLVLLGAGWVIYHVLETRRELALEKLARRRGLDFRFGLPQGLRDALPRFRVIEKARESGGEFQAGINSVGGLVRGRKLAFFDFEWVTVSYFTSRRSFWSDEQEQRHRHRRSAIAVELGVSLPPVLVRPERLVDKALALAGYDDIDFPSLPEFSGRFYVNGPDPAAARRLVTPAFARFCLEELRVTVDIAGPWLLLHDNGTLSASRAEPLIDLAARLADLVTREQAASR